jgi:hypothetical protein
VIFGEYLQRLKSAGTFANERGWSFLRKIPITQRRKIYARLAEVDPEGLSRIHRLYRSLGGKAQRQYKKPTKEFIENGLIALAQQQYEGGAILKFRFVSGETILNVCAALLAAGYSKQEVSDKLDIEPELVCQVTPEQIAAVKKSIPKYIIEAADQRVYRDLLSGEVTKETAMADKIATKRRDLLLKAMKEDRSSSGGLSPQAQKKKLLEYGAKFGVTVNVNEKETQDENRDG